ncbi:hypothetical protein M1349_05690 [Patescibacteria group bacterium]|nr:hypothetical protein [Patescibacteria group bacterium]
MNQEINIQYLDKPKRKVNPFCDKHSYDSVHSESAVEHRVEPVSELTPGDKHNYYVMLKRFGVPKEDAQKAVAIAENFCPRIPAKTDTQGHQLTPAQIGQPERSATNTGIIRNVVGNFKDLISHPNRQQIPVTQDIISFERRS